jgi:hypothetical protein
MRLSVYLKQDIPKKYIEAPETYMTFHHFCQTAWIVNVQHAEGSQFHPRRLYIRTDIHTSLAVGHLSNFMHCLPKFGMRSLFIWGEMVFVRLPALKCLFRVPRRILVLWLKRGHEEDGENYITYNLSCFCSILSILKNMYKSTGIWDSSVETTTCYGLGSRSSIPGRCKRFFSSPRRSDWLWSPPSLPSSRYRGLFPREWSG